MKQGTFLDAVCTYIIKNDNINEEIVSELKYMLMEEEFDSDALVNDIECNNGNQSNIKQYLNDKNAYYGIKKAINHFKGMLYKYLQV